MEEKYIVIKLASGEELIAIDGGLSKDNKIVLNYAISTVPYQDGSIGFSPFIGAAKTEVLEVKKEHVMFGPLVPQDDMLTAYKEVLAQLRGESVILPEKKDIII